MGYEWSKLTNERVRRSRYAPCPCGGAFHCDAEGGATSGRPGGSQHPAVQHPSVQHPAVQHPSVRHPSVQHPQGKYLTAGYKTRLGAPLCSYTKMCWSGLRCGAGLLERRFLLCSAPPHAIDNDSPELSSGCIPGAWFIQKPPLLALQEGRISDVSTLTGIKNIDVVR